MKSHGVPKWRTWIGALLLLMVVPESVAAQATSGSQVLSVMGSSTVYNDKVSYARERAISDALAAALEQATARQVPLEALVQNFQQLNEAVFATPDAFVEGYKVLTESRVGDTYRVIVEATVSADRLQERLGIIGIMVGKQPMPRVLLILNERRLNGIIGDDSRYSGADQREPTAERAVIDALKSAGFILVGTSDAAASSYSATSPVPAIDRDEAIRIGASLRADVVVIGSAEADYAPNTMGGQINSFEAVVSLQAIKADTGDRIAEVRQNAVTAHADETLGSRKALFEAGRRAGSALAGQVVTAWKQKSPYSQIRMMVDGTRNLGNFVVFRRALTQIPGVQELQTREIRADQANLVVNFDGSEQDLADALLLQTFDGFGIHISDVSTGRMHVELLSRR